MSVPQEEVLDPQGTSEPNSETPSQDSEKTPAPPEPEPEAEIDFEKIDPAKLPPEVAKYYKGMQASYTRRMQGLKTSYENLQSHATRLSMLDKAMAGDKEAAMQLSKIIGLQQHQEKPVGEDELGEDFQFESPKHLVKYMDGRFGKMIEAAITKHLGQIQAPVQEIQAKMAYEARRNEYESLKKEYPDIDARIPDMLEIQKQYPGLGIADLYKLATWKNPVKPEQIVSKPGARPAAAKPKASLSKTPSWDEAAAAAIEELKTR